MDTGLTLASGASITYSEVGPYTIDLADRGKNGTGADFVRATASVDADSHRADGIVQNVDASADWDIFVLLFDLDPSKTAVLDREIEYEWDIDKTATPDWNLFDGDTGTSTYTVEVTKSLVSDEYTISGVITIENPAPVAIEVTVTDSIDGQPAVVDCDGDNVVTIPAEGQVECDYVLTGAAGDEDLNTATVTITDGAEYFNDPSYDATAAVVAGTTNTILDEITVTDTNANFGGPRTTSESDSWDYEITFSCENVTWDGLTGSYTFPNRAEIDETGDYSDAEIDVDCYRLDIEKTADTEFDRQYFWDITKVVDGDASAVVPAGSTQATFSYQVEVDVTGSTDSGHAVSGTVTITNPNPTRAAVLTSLVDTLNDGTVVALDCDWPGADNEIPADSSVECTYDLAIDGDETQNDVTATQQNYDFAHDDLVGTESGTTDYDADAAISFGAPTTVTDECVDLSDSDYDFGGTTPEICADDVLPAVFNYDITWDLNPEIACGVPQEFTNIAMIVTNDTATEHDDDAVVDVTVECEGFQGCTPGFWKTHTGVWMGFGPDDTLGEVFGDVGASFTNVTLLEALNFGGGGGIDGAKRNLFRAAVASLLNGAHPDVAFTISNADLIAMIDVALDSNNRGTILALAADLDADNNLGCGIDAHGNPVLEDAA